MIENDLLFKMRRRRLKLLRRKFLCLLKIFSKKLAKILAKSKSMYNTSSDLIEKDKFQRKEESI